MPDASFAPVPSTTPGLGPAPVDPRIRAADAWAAEVHQKAQVTANALEGHAQDAARANDSEGVSLIRNLAAGWTESTLHAAGAIAGGVRMVSNLVGDTVSAGHMQSVEQFLEESAQLGPRPTRAALGTGSWADVNPFHNPAYFAYNLGSLGSTVAQIVTPGAALKALNLYRAGVPAMIKAASLGEDAIRLAPEVAERSLRWGRAMSNVGATAGELATVATEIGVKPDVFAKAVQASRPLFDDPAALQAFGAKIGAVEAAHIQAYGTYKRVKEAGGNELQALSAYGAMAFVTGKLDHTLLTRWFGEFPPDLKGRLINAAATVGTNAAIPVADALTQWATDNVGQKLGADPLDKTALMNFQQMVQTVQAGLGPSALLGMLMGNGYSKREKQTADPTLEPGPGEPAHGATGFVGKRDALFNFYGVDKPISGHRITDEGDGHFLVKGQNGESDARVPYEKTESVYTKNNPLGEEGSLLWEDNPDQNPVAQKYMGDKKILDMGVDVDKIARKQREALERRTTRSEANRMQAEDFHSRVQEALAAPEGERRGKAIEAVMQSLGESGQSLLGRAMQPATNRAMHKVTEIGLAQAQSELDALQSNVEIARSPEGPLILNRAKTKVSLLTGRRDYLDLMHNDMLQALGSAGEAASVLGGKKAARQMGAALATDPEQVQAIRASLEAQRDQFASALDQTQGLPPGTDLRLQAEQGLKETEASLALFDRFAPLEGEATAGDLGGEQTPPATDSSPPDPEALRALGYTPEEVNHLGQSGRAGDVLAANLARPVTYGAGVASTIEALRAAGVPDSEQQSRRLTGVRANAAETALALLPQAEVEQAWNQNSSAEAALLVAQQDHAHLASQAQSLREIMGQIRPEALAQDDPVGTGLAEFRGALEATEQQLAVLQRDYPQLKEVPRTVSADIPGLGTLVDDRTVVDRTSKPRPKQGAGREVTANGQREQGIEGVPQQANADAREQVQGRQEGLLTGQPHLDKARAVLPSLPPEMGLFLDEAISAEAARSGEVLTPEGEMFRDALRLHTDPTRIGRALGEAMLTFQEHTGLHGNTFKATTVQAIARALGVDARPGANFGLHSNTGNYRLFQTGSPLEQINQAVKRFNEVAEIPQLRKTPSLVKKLLRGEMSPLEVAATLLEARGDLLIDSELGKDDNGNPRMTIQLTHEKVAERNATVHALAKLAYLIQDGLGASLGKHYTPTVLTPGDLPLMNSTDWDARYREALEPGAWLSDLRQSLRGAAKEAGAEIRGEEEVSFLRLFHGMMEHAATMQGKTAETAAREWLEARAGSGSRPYAKDAFFGIAGTAGGPEQNLGGRRGERWVPRVQQGGPLEQAQGDNVKGWFEVFQGPAGPRGLITLTKHADFTTLVEELAHFTRTTLAGDNYSSMRSSINAFLKAKGLPEIRSEAGGDHWSREAEEVFAKWTLQALREPGRARDVPPALRATLEKIKPVLESYWDSTLDVYGEPPAEARAGIIRLFNPLLPRANATGKMVGVRIREQATKHGVNTFTATMFTPEQVELAATFALGTEGTARVYEAEKTNKETVFAEVSEHAKNPLEANRQINQALDLGTNPKASLIVFQAIQAASDSIPAIKALMSAKTFKQRREAKAYLDNLPAVLMKKRIGVLTGQALWAHSLDPISQILNVTNGVLQLSKQMTTGDARRLFQTIEDARGGSQEALEQLVKTNAVLEAEAPHLTDYLKQIIYGGMLFSPRIHATNAIMIGVMSGMMKLPLKATAALVDAGWSYASGKPREIFFHEMLTNKVAIRAGFNRGRKGFYDIMAHGLTDDPLDNARKLTDSDRYTQHQLAFEHAPDVLHIPLLGDRAWGSKLRAIAPLVSIATNFAHGTDYFLRAIIYHDNLWQASLRRALQEGASDPHLIANRLMKRAMDGTQDTASMRQEASLLSFQATGGDQPGTFTKNVIAAKNSFGIAAVPFMPFVNTLANLMKRSAELVPFLGYATWKSQVREQLGKDTPTFYVDKPQEMVGKQIFGGVMGMVLASMFQKRDKDGLPEVTGSLPQEAGERDFWRRNGIIPYSVKVGGRYVQFSRVDPIGMVLMGAANVADSWSHYQAGQSDPREEKNANAYAATETFFNNMFRDVIGNSFASNFFKLADKDGSNAQEILRSLTVLVPYSGFMRQLSSLAWTSHNNGEYVAPDVGPAFGALLGVVPFAWSGADVQPRRDAFGKPIVYRAQGMFTSWLPVQVSEGTPLDPVEKELRRLGVYPSVPLPTKKVSLVPNGQQFDIPPDLYAQMVTEYGIRGKEALAGIIGKPAYERMRDGSMQGVLGQARVLNRALEHTRESYGKWLKGEMGKRLQAGILERPVALVERPEVDAPGS